ncbi:MAG: SWIM zinc finger family protein [Candidatus Taylorbacteria bacterium]
MNNIFIPQFTITDIQLGVGDHEYHVNVDCSSYDRGNCDCYIGQKDEPCKHMLALAIALVYK